MKDPKKFKQAVLGVALATVLLLMVPLVAMQFTSEIDWKPGDFIVAGILLFGSGFSYVLVARYAPNMAYRVALALGFGAMLFMVWANLAVGLIGAGPHPGNLMYIGVLLTGITGSILSGFRTRGMERTMYAMAFATLLIAVIALLTGMQHYPGSSVNEILGVNGFFILLYGVSGLAFRYAAEGSPARTTSGEEAR